MAAITGVGLSTADYAPGLADLGGALDFFETLGIDSVELSLSNFEVIGGCRIYPDRLAELKRICADRPFAYTVHGPIASGFTDPRHLRLQVDACRACLDVSGEIGASVQVHHSGMMPHVTATQREDLLGLERDALTGIAPHAADAGVILCVETLFTTMSGWTSGPDELAAQIATVGHANIAACIDFSHVYLNAGERGFDPLPGLGRLAPLTRHLHVHDSFGLPESFMAYHRSEAALFGLGDLHLPPGRGSLPWGALAALPFAGPTVANLELTTPHRDQLDAAVKWTRGWIAQTG